MLPPPFHALKSRFWWQKGTFKSVAANEVPNQTIGPAQKPAGQWLARSTKQD